MSKDIALFVLVNLLLRTSASPQWMWEDEDPYYSTSQKPTRPPTKSTTTSTTSSGSVTTSPDIQFRRCIKRCPSTNEYNPVCGNDNQTYTNQGKLLCAKKCGARVDKLYDGACSGQTSTVTTAKPTTISTQATTPSSVTPNPVCFKNCPKTAEYNPICGTNNVSYSNESRMRCAQQCGVRVQKLFDGLCGTATSSSSSIRPPTKMTTLPPNFRSCIRQCIVSSQYVPVCSSDGTTYNNDSELTCDISCGRTVQKVRNGAC